MSVIIGMFILWNYTPHFFHTLSSESYHAGSSWDCDWNGNEICSIAPAFSWFLPLQGVIFDLRTAACSATVSDTITSTRTHLHLLKEKRFGLFWSFSLFIPPFNSKMPASEQMQRQVGMWKYTRSNTQETLVTEIKAETATWMILTDEIFTDGSWSQDRTLHILRRETSQVILVVQCRILHSL